MYDYYGSNIKNKCTVNYEIWLLCLTCHTFREIFTKVQVRNLLRIYTILTYWLVIDQIINDKLKKKKKLISEH